MTASNATLYERYSWQYSGFDGVVSPCSKPSWRKYIKLPGLFNNFAGYREGTTKWILAFLHFLLSSFPSPPRESIGEKTRGRDEKEGKRKKEREREREREEKTSDSGSFINKRKKRRIKGEQSEGWALGDENGGWAEARMKSSEVVGRRVTRGLRKPPNIYARQPIVRQPL